MLYMCDGMIYKGWNAGYQKVKFEGAGVALPLSGDPQPQ